MAGSTPASPSVDAMAPRRAASHSPWAEAWRRFKRHRMALASLVLLTLMVLLVVFGPWFWTVAINDIDFTARMQTPSWKHPMGTDDLGQDLFARMLYGGRISMAVGLAAMLMAIFVGVLVGALAGISRRWVDTALMWLTDLFLSLPQLPLLRGGFVRVPCLGTLSRLKGVKISSNVYTSYRTDQAFSKVCTLAGLSSSEYQALDNGKTTLTLWWCGDDDAFDMLCRILAAEGPGAAIYEDGQGRITFHSRHYRLLTTRSTTSQVTFGNGT